MPTQVTASFIYEANETGSGGGGQVATYAPREFYRWRFSDGTSADQLDRVYFGEEIAGGTSVEDINVQGVTTFSSLVGAIAGGSSTVSIAELVGFAFINIRGNGALESGHTMTIGGGSAQVAGHLGGSNTTIGPVVEGGFIFMIAPGAAGLSAVTASQNYGITRSISSGRSQFCILGRSA